MVFAPFGTGKGKRTWASELDYERDFHEFMGANVQRLGLEVVEEMWFSRKNHMGPDGYRKYVAKGRPTKGLPLIHRQTRGELELVQKGPPPSRRKPEPRSIASMAGQARRAIGAPGKTGAQGRIHWRIVPNPRRKRK